ncbi:MAG: DNA polymerase III subunit beta [Salinivirgaceae bacterium]|nr:DNA polymerase III subunit beta [Salinivirgaceae bacterium]
MNFIVSSTQLLNHLQAVSRVIASKNTMEILNNFLFKLEDDKLTITASDVETTMITTIDVENASDNGTIAIDAKRLTDILKEFPEQPLTFNINNQTFSVDIVSENGKFSVLGQNGDDFPQINSQRENVSVIRMSSDTLLQGVSKTLFAAMTDDIRPALTGIFFEISEGKIKFVATDAHKLVCYGRADVQTEGDSSFIFPQKPANLLKNILPKTDAQVTLSFNKQEAVIEFNEYTLICRLIEGSYPNYQAIIPNDSPRKLIVDRLELCNCLRRVSIFSNQASNLIKLSITANQLTVSAQDIDFSISAHERVKCQFEGDDMEIGFCSTYLIQILSNLNCDEVVVNLSDSTRPGKFVPLNQSSVDEDVLMILMPMSIN